MGRSEIRDLIRQAQSAEISGELDQAVELLSQAAHQHLEKGESKRGAALLRHCLRLKPGRSDLRDEADRVEAKLPAEEAPPAREALEVARRGPMPADPALDCWCSFCCRPKSEAGPMVAGPAGAFICRTCVGASADLVCAPSVKTVEGAAEVHPAPAPELLEPVPAHADPAPAKAGGASFIEAAVELSKELGWSLADIRTLSPDEIAQALARLGALKR